MNVRKRMKQLAGINEMAIRGYEDERISAKEKAKDIVFAALQITGYWTEDTSYGSKDMTSKEKSEVQRHIDKFVDRFEKMLKL